MKKLFFPAVVIAAITLASCAQQDFSDEIIQIPISFRTFVGKSTGVNTKATELVTSLLETNGFIVQAYKTEQTPWVSYAAPSTAAAAGDFMTNQLAKHESTGWGYSPIKYWPANSGRITFFAYGGSKVTGTANGIPSGVTSFAMPTGTDGPAPSLSFTVPDNISDQVDLVADALYDETGGTVAFVLNHILSKIAFTAQLASALPTNPNTTLTINSAKITFGANKVQLNGTYTFGSSDHAAGTWALGTANKSYLSSSARDILTSAVTLSTSATSINTASGYLMLIPQSIGTGDFFTITFTYTIANGDSKTYTATKTINNTNALALDQGKQYTYNFKFSPTAITITLSTLPEWIPGSPIDTNI